MTREAVMTALLALLTSGGTFLTSGRRVLPWNKVASQPALFLRHVGEQVSDRPTGMPPRTILECEAWIYNKVGGDEVPDTALNALLDAVETLLLPNLADDAQTLGGVVQHCWIEGKTEIYPGDLDNQAIAVVPIRVLVPILAG